MTTNAEKKDFCATWDGSLATLAGACAISVRSHTIYKRRQLLGAEVASRLTGKAWDIVSTQVDHERLRARDGPAYLLQFLEDRFC